MVWDLGGALNAINHGQIGNAIGDLVGFDLTPGYNVRNPLASTAPTVSQPQPTVGINTQPTGDPGSYTSSGGVNYYTGGASGSTAPAYDPAVISQYDQASSTLNDALNRLGVQLNIAKGNIDKSYSTQNNELTTAKTNNENQYNTSTTENQQQYRTNKNSINDQASAGLRGLMRMLGAYGAVGSDTQLASGAVNDTASAQRAGSGQTYAQNQNGLDTNWNNYLADWGNSHKKLDDWHTSQLNSAEAQSATNRQDLLTKLADIRGQRAAALGGSYAGGAQTYLDQAKGLSGRIDQLGALNPTYDGTTPTYTQRPLDSYAAPDRAQASMTGSNSSASPYLAMLGLDDKRKALR